MKSSIEYDRYCNVRSIIALKVTNQHMPQKIKEMSYVPALAKSNTAQFTQILFNFFGAKDITGLVRVTVVGYIHHEQALYKGAKIKDKQTYRDI